MRSSKRRVVQPLNFTPDEPKGRGAQERSRPELPPMPKPVALRPSGEPEGGDADGPRRAPGLPGWARRAYLYAALASVTWAGMLLAYSIGYVGGVAGLFRAPMQLAVVTLMAALPSAFIFLAAYAWRQGARLAAEARWARATAEDFLTPAALAVAKSGELAGAVRAEVERVSAAALSAHGQLISVRETLAGESDRLTEAAAQAQHTARAVGEALGRERDALAGLLSDLGAQAGALADGVERQSRLVGEASDLARSQLQEAEANLASGAARLAAATGAVGASAREAGEGLAHHAERLDTTAAALSERLRFLDSRLNEQRHALSNLLHTLDTDQEDVAARFETFRAQMLDVIAEARVSAAELGTASTLGGEAVRGLLGGALDQTREIAAVARAEQAALRTEAAEARLAAQNELHGVLDALARAGEDARRTIAAATAETEAAAGARVSAARHEVDQLGELAFAAGQRADQAFQSRLGEARRLIEQTAALVEEAGRRAGERIDAGLDASRSALGELASALGDIDAQLARLPASARAQADGVRAAVERSLADLTAAARRASEETQELDAAFQDRIRRNYEMLSEAVRLMGRVAGSPEAGREPTTPPVPPPPEPRPEAAPPAEVILSEAAAPDPFAAYRRAAEPVRTEAPRPEPARTAFAGRPAPAPPVFGRAAAREPEPAEAAGGPADLLFEPERPAPDAPPAVAEPQPLRPRLKLTPTEADEALKAVFQARPEAEAATGARPPARRGEWDSDLDEWTWKDLLTSMDDGPTDTDALAEQMIREIEGLGVDAAALLPRARIEDVAAALVSGDRPAARDAVRRLAPAAIRRLSRRVLTDRALREQVDRYVERYQSLLADIGGGVAEAAERLGSDAGRAYLLLEAAVGDL
jgi:hypothetical protein